MAGQKKLSEDTVFNTFVNSTDYYDYRMGCITGEMAGLQDAGEYYFKEGNFTAQHLCKRIVTHSAQVEASPAARKNNPDADLLAPYRMIAISKGFKPTDGNAQFIVNQVVDAASKHPNVTTFDLTLSNGKHLKIPAGLAFDAAYVKATQAALGGHPLPRSTQSPQSLDAKHNACIYNSDGNQHGLPIATLGSCKATGEAMASQRR